MKKGKKLIILTLAAFALTAMSGCGQGTTDSSSNSLSGNTESSSSGSSGTSEVAQVTGSTTPDDGNWHPDKPITIKWATWEYNSTEGQDYLKKSLDLYKEYQPNITVEYEYIANDQYQTWLQTQLMGGTAPDLFLVRHAWGQQYLRDGTVVDLTDYLNNEINPYNGNQNWMSTLQESVMAQVMDPTNGRYASVPTNGVLCKLFYNKDLMEKAGIDKLPSTFVELLETCKTLEGAGITPMVVGMKVAEGGGFHWYERMIMDPLATQFVEELDINKTGLIEVNEIARGVDKGIIDITQEPWKDIYPLIKELSQYWYPGFTAMDNNEALEQFMRGEVAMTFTVGLNAKIMASNPDLNFEIGITEFPTLTTESHPRSSGIAYEIGGAPQGNLCIPTTIKGDQLLAALDFLKFKTGLEDSGLYVNELWGVTPVKNVQVDAENPILQSLQFKNDVSPLKLYETYFDKQFFDDSVMYGQLYLQDKLSLEEYTKLLQDDLVKAKDSYVKKEGWSDENNWGEN